MLPSYFVNKDVNSKNLKIDGGSMPFFGVL